MELSSLQPSNDGLLVQVMEMEPGPVLLPVTAGQIGPGGSYSDLWATRYKVRWARVIRTGPGKRNPKTGEHAPLDVKEGDKISFAGMTKAEDGDYVLICQDDVLLVEGKEN
jgi:co-chaperonin GroES (HSP10)